IVITMYPGTNIEHGKMVVIMEGCKKTSVNLSIKYAHLIGNIDLGKEPIFFTRNEIWPHRCFDNMYYSEFIFDDELFFCVEEPFQREKSRMFKRPDLWEPVIAARKVMGSKSLKDPLVMKEFAGLCKRTGRVRFTEYNDTEWGNHKESFLDEVVRIKFLQNPDMAKILLDTEDRMIYEISFEDAVYATGTDGLGGNRTGVAVMAARKYLSENPEKIHRHHDVDAMVK